MMLLGGKAVVMVCYFCGQKLDMGGVVGRHEICPQCHRDVRCCLNCAFHDPGAHNQCREPQSEEIRERDQSNFCEFFAVNDAESPTVNEDSVQKARNELDRLFKKPEG